MRSGWCSAGSALELVGVGIALAAILVGLGALADCRGVRYVANAYHRRLLLTARHVVVVTAIALVLVLHFASELTALVAALGFAAAGIAFALQNVILAVAGYFSMVAPNGIRVGDRVSLQGPFGYVHGEVLEIGVVRTRLRELSGEPLRRPAGSSSFPTPWHSRAASSSTLHPKSAPARRRSPGSRAPRPTPTGAVKRREGPPSDPEGRLPEGLQCLCVAHATHCRQDPPAPPGDRTPGNQSRLP